MKNWAILSFLLIMISCSSESSSVCDNVEPDQLCIDYKTSTIGVQSWHKTNTYFIVHISNDPKGNTYIPQIDIYFRLFDHENGITPQQGSYKGVSLISASLTADQFDLDMFIDGKQDYVLDVAEVSSFEIEVINGTVLDGKAHCYFKHTSKSSDKKQLNLNFQGAVNQ
jgi:hypothetical protein